MVQAGFLPGSNGEQRPYAIINPGRLGDGLKESRIHSTRIPRSDGLATATLLLTLSRFDQKLFRRNNSHADSLA